MNEASPSVPHPLALVRLRYAAAGAILASAAVTPFTIQSEMASPLPTVAEPAPRPLPPAGLSQCPETSPSAFSAVQHLFEHPGTPLYPKANRMAKQFATERIRFITAPLPENIQIFDSPPIAATDRAKAEFLLRQATARKYGLTVHDSTAYIKQLYGMSNEFEPRALPFSARLAATQQFARTAGIEIRAATPADHLGKNVATSKNGIFTGPDANENLESIAQAIASWPQEYIAHAGLRRILLAKNIKPFEDSNVEPAAFAQTSDPHDTYVIDMSTGVDTKANDHEMYHLVHAAECGGPNAAANDPGYTAYNDTGTQYNNGKEQKGDALTREEWSMESSLAADALLRAAEEKDPIAFCRANAGLHQTTDKVSLSTSYSPVNSVEDEAEEGKVIPSAIYSGELSSNFPRIRQKFTYLLGRMYMYQPRLARYFADLGVRPEPPIWSVPCNGPTPPR